MISEAAELAKRTLQSTPVKADDVDDAFFTEYSDLLGGLTLENDLDILDALTSAAAALDKNTDLTLEAISLCMTLSPEGSWVVRRSF